MPDPAKDFIKAAKRGDLAGLRTLLESDSGLIGVRDSDGSTALHCATWKGHEEAVAFLLDAGANIHAHNDNDHWGTTALHAAAHANHVRIAQRLIDARGRRERERQGGADAAGPHNLPQGNGHRKGAFEARGNVMVIGH